MSFPIKFTDYVPVNLVGVNAPTKTLAAEAVTSLPIPTGAQPGEAFYLSESFANQLSATAANGAPPLQCHAGWYVIVQISAAAVLANIQQGAIGLQYSLAAGRAVMTDVSTALAAAAGLNPCVWLAGTNGTYFFSPTVGFFTIVQIGGDASVLVAANQTVLTGSLLTYSATTGLCSIVTAAANLTQTNYPLIVGVAEAALTTPAALTLSAAAAASGGSTVYAGTITGGGSNAFAGLYFVITGFDLTANNGTFLCTASTTTTLTLTNANGVADTHAGTATSQGLVRCLLGFPFGGIK